MELQSMSVTKIYDCAKEMKPWNWVQMNYIYKYKGMTYMYAFSSCFEYCIGRMRWNEKQMGDSY